MPAKRLAIDDQYNLNETWQEKQAELKKLSNDYMTLLSQKQQGIPLEEGHIKILTGKLLKLKKELCNAELITTQNLNNTQEVQSLLCT